MTVVSLIAVPLIYIFPCIVTIFPLCFFFIKWIYKWEVVAQISRHGFILRIIYAEIVTGIHICLLGS